MKEDRRKKKEERRKTEGRRKKEEKRRTEKEERRKEKEEVKKEEGIKGKNRSTDHGGGRGSKLANPQMKEDERKQREER